jgi:hypothetical protein
MMRDVWFAAGLWLALCIPTFAIEAEVHRSQSSRPLLLVHYMP